VDVAFDGAGNIFIADGNNSRVRRVDAATGIMTTVAGNGVVGFSGDGGPPTSAALGLPASVAIDASGALLILDFENNRVRRVDGAAVANPAEPVFSWDLPLRSPPSFCRCGCRSRA
jgi:sugar lactone lactonase YvrE